MVKLRNPLISLAASNTISKAITFVRRRSQNIAEKKPEIKDVQSTAQLSWRHMYQKCAALWHTLSDAEQAEWNSLGGIKHMTGFAYWQSQCLRPNPGIYLPLQGGTMSGNIDMAKNRILRLPLPVDSQEALTLAYYTATIEPQMMNEGARVYHNAAQAIPNNAITTLAFNSERYDTDSIHDTVINNSRLTCKTAGKYIIIGHAAFASAAAIGSAIYIRHQGATIIAQHSEEASVAFAYRIEAATIYDLAVGEYVELRVYQFSGAPLNIVYAPQYSPEFMMQRIGA